MADLLTVDSDIWFDELMMHAPGVTKKGMQQAIGSALRMFCQQSGAWLVELWDDDGGSPVPFYAPGQFLDLQAVIAARRADEVAELAGGVTCPTHESGDPTQPWTGYHTLADYWPWDVLYIHGVTYFEAPAGQELGDKGRPLRALPTPGSRSVYHAAEASVGYPQFYRTFVERPGVIEFTPAIGATPGPSGVVPYVALQIPLNCCTTAVPVVFQQHWYHVILDGALAMLFGQPDKPYSNAGQAVFRGRSFRNGMAQARDTARHQLGNSESLWRFPRWA